MLQQQYILYQYWGIDYYLSTYLVILYLTVWFVPEAVDTVEDCTPEDGRLWRPKPVEWT